MAGHSHWAGIKHKKGLADKKRGKLFSKLSKNIMSSIKESGGNIDQSTNLKLRYAVDKAKEGNMPKANIERAIKKAAGISKGSSEFSELSYEGYAAGGIAVMAEIITDNRNRTASEIKKLFEIKGGKLGATGCVSYMFDAKGIIIVLKEKIEEEKLMDIALESGAEDVVTHEEVYEIVTGASELPGVKQALEELSVEIESAEISKVPQNKVTVDDPKNAKKVLDLISALEEYDDIDSVYANYDIPDEVMATIEQEE